MENTTKAHLIYLLEKGELTECIQLALTYANTHELTNVKNQLKNLNNRLKEHYNSWKKKPRAYDRYSRVYIEAHKDLASLIDLIPDHPGQVIKRTGWFTERTFKNLIFYSIIVVKVILFFQLVIHWRTGGFNYEQFKATVILLLSAFAAYITVMLTAYLKKEQIDLLKPEYVRNQISVFFLFAMPAYLITIIVLINMKAEGEMSFAQMTFWIGTVESVLGGFVAKIVYGLFTN